jgi:NADPH-dependent ferric siderophore reductase
LRESCHLHGKLLFKARRILSAFRVTAGETNIVRIHKQHFDAGGTSSWWQRAQRAQTPYLVGARLTIADISLHGYTHVADQSGLDLSLYPAIQAWLDHISAHSGYTGRA